jgi:hypothetical protein
MQTHLIEQLMALRLRGMVSALEESLTALSQKKLAPTSWLTQPPTVRRARIDTSCVWRTSRCRATLTASTSANRL